MTTYHNTNNLDEERLVKAIQNNKTQEDIVLLIFKDEKKPLSASKVWNLYNQTDTPLTSIRRAITNLMNERKLVKTDIKVMGIYGKPEYLYKLSEV